MSPLTIVVHARFLNHDRDRRAMHEEFPSDGGHALGMIRVAGADLCR
jgi:hypothetical protein